jgi:hypothetical protein
MYSDTSFTRYECYQDGDRYNFPSTPVSHHDATVVDDCLDGGRFRFTVLTDRLLRYERSKDGEFESTFAINRRFDPPKFRWLITEDSLKVVTEFFHLYYDRKEFTSAGLAVTVTLGNDTWRHDSQNQSSMSGLPILAYVNRPTLYLLADIEPMSTTSTQHLGGTYKAYEHHVNEEAEEAEKAFEASRKDSEAADRQIFLSSLLHCVCYGFNSIPDPSRAVNVLRLGQIWRPEVSRLATLG